MQLTLDGALGARVRLQSGVVSRQQVAAAGIPLSVIDNQLRYGRWQRLHSGVYATFTGPLDREAELWAVVLRLGPFSALSHYTAAELHGVTTQHTGLIHVTVSPGLRVQPIGGVVIHRTVTFNQVRWTSSQLPRTSVADTVLDLTQVSRRLDDAVDWICKGVGRGLTTPDLLMTALQARKRVRWRADLLGALGDVSDGVRSPLEYRYVRDVERAHGLPRAVRQAAVSIDDRTIYLDNLYEEAGVVVELDGAAYHPPEQRWADSHRDNDRATHGNLTLRYNWPDVTSRRCATAAQVAAVLGARGMTVRLCRCAPSCTAV